MFQLIITILLLIFLIFFNKYYYEKYQNSSNYVNKINKILNVENGDLCQCHGKINFYDKDDKLVKSFLQKDLYNELGIFNCDGSNLLTKDEKSSIVTEKTTCDSSPEFLKKCANNDNTCNCNGLIYYGKENSNDYKILYDPKSDEPCYENKNIICEGKKFGLNSNIDGASCFCDGVIFTNKDIFNKFVFSINKEGFKIKYIKENFFNDTLKKINTLYLNNNDIQYFHEDTFKELTDLQLLDLSGNRNIQFLYENMFENCSKLNYIILSKNEKKIKILVNKSIDIYDKSLINESYIKSILGLNNAILVKNEIDQKINNKSDYSKNMFSNEDYSEYFELEYKDDYVNHENMGLYSCKNKYNNLLRNYRIENCFETNFSNETMSKFEKDLKLKRLENLYDKFKTEIKLLENPNKYALKIDDSLLLESKKSELRKLELDIKNLK